MSDFQPPRSGPPPEPGEDRVVDRLDFALRNLRGTPQVGDEPALLQPAEPVSLRHEPAGESSPDQRRAALAVTFGHAHFSAGTLESAEREYRDALAADAANGDAHASLALTLARMGRLEEAEQQLREAEAAGVRVSPTVLDQIRAARNS
jgi:hypothetical protein